METTLIQLVFAQWDGTSLHSTLSLISLPRYTLYQTIMSFFLPLPLIITCYMLILCYTWRMYQKNKRERR